MNIRGKERTLLQWLSLESSALDCWANAFRLLSEPCKEDGHRFTMSDSWSPTKHPGKSPTSIRTSWRRKLESKLIPIQCFAEKHWTTDFEEREGFRDVNELKIAYSRKTTPGESSPISSVARPPAFAGQTPPPPPSPQTSDSSQTTSSSPTQTTDPPGVKNLSSFVNVDKLLELPEKEIEYLWRLRHSRDPRSLCAVIAQATYRRIESTARRHPQFILPLPRETQGAEIHFLQWTFPTPSTSTILFTHLAEFKARGEYAQPHTTVTHHLDIADIKGLVLLQGSVVEGRGITAEEAKWLLMCLQKFYGDEDKVERKRLLEQFSQGDGDFKVEHLLEEAEKIL